MFLFNILLALAWIAITGQFTLANFLLGLVLSFALLWLAQRAGRPFGYFGKVGKIIRFIGYFLGQLVMANLRVTYDILTPRPYMLPAVVAVPLDLKTPAQITLLANLITLTPGTLSLDVSPDQRTLYVHTMHLSDADEFVQEIKNGFEQYIEEIFE